MISSAQSGNSIHFFRRLWTNAIQSHHHRDLAAHHVHNGAAGLDTRSPAKRQISTIAAKRGSNRTEADDLRLVELECQNSLYLDDDGRPTLPAAALRAALEAAARKTKQGGDVREGLLVESLAFTYDVKRYGTTVEEIGKSAQFTVPVVVQRARILRTRAKFDCPWSD